MIRILELALLFAATVYFIRQCRKPTGLLGRFLLSTMNQSHANLTTWGLEHAQVGEHDTILDIGCGGGRTIERLAAIASQGKVYGVDYSATSVAASRKLNAAEIQAGRIDIQQASVSNLPLPDATLDLVTAVETHYYWPDRPAAMREILRVLKPGGRLLMIAEVYSGPKFALPIRMVMGLLGGACLTEDEHRDLLVKAGFEKSQVFIEPSHGWICATGTKPLPPAELDSEHRPEGAAPRLS